MSEHKAQVRWSRQGVEFKRESYSRDHEIQFESGTKVWASSAPQYQGSADAVNPEEMLVGALSSCHMLTFLAVAANSGYVVDAYEDDAVGVLEKGPDGRTVSITRVELRPRVTFSGAKLPDEGALKVLHDKAHKNCFIANSVKTEVTVVPSPVQVAQAA